MWMNGLTTVRLHGAGELSPETQGCMSMHLADGSLVGEASDRIREAAITDPGSFPAGDLERAESRLAFLSLAPFIQCLSSVTHMDSAVAYENTEDGWVSKDGSDTSVL